MQTLNDVLKFALTLLSILNPIGVLPVFLSFIRTKKNLNIKKISSVAAWATGLTIFISLALGQILLEFFGISISSFTVGGGILLFTMAFAMISASPSQMLEGNLEKLNCEREIGIVPLAIPLLSGPGVISTCIIQAKGFSSIYHWLGAAVVAILIGVLIKYLLAFAQTIGKHIGVIGINVMSRVMGLLLLAMAIEMIASGMKELLPLLKLSQLPV